MSKDLVFFDKEGNYINTKYNNETEKYEGDLIFHENGSDTFKTIGLYLFENIKSFQFNAPDELFLSKFQLFNERGFTINGSETQNVKIDKVLPTNSDVKYFTKWVYAPNIENLFPIGSSMVFKNSITEFTNINKTYTVLNSKRGAVMIITDLNNLLYSTNYPNQIYDNVYISGVNYIGIVDYRDQNSNNLISNWSEPRFNDVLYVGRKLNIIGTENNNRVVTINDINLLDKNKFKYACDSSLVTGDLSVTINLKTNNPNIYSGGVIVNKNRVFFLDGVPDVLLPGRSFKVESILNPYYVIVDKISLFKSNLGITEYSIGDQVLFENKIFQCYVAYTQTATSIITPLDINYWSDNITFVDVTSTMNNETISCNVYLSTNTFTYNQPYLGSGIKTITSFLEQYQEEFKLFNISLSVSNGVLASVLDFSDKWAEVLYKVGLTDLTRVTTTVERIISVNENLTSENCVNISEQFQYNIIFTDVDDFGILVNINGMPYAEELVPIYNGNSLDLNRSIDKTLRNWLSNNYVRLYTLGIVCELKSIDSITPLYYNTIVLKSYYPNVPMDFEVVVGSTASYHIENTMVTFRDLGNFLTITLNNKDYAISVINNLNGVDIISTLSNWCAIHRDILRSYDILVTSKNNNLFIDTLTQDAIKYEVVVKTTKLNVPGDELYKIVKRKSGNNGALIASNSITLDIDSELSFETNNFATGMIVGINNTIYPFNNQDYNIISVNPNIMNLSYQGPFWDSHVGNKIDPSTFPGEFSSSEFNRSEFLVEYIRGNDYELNAYSINSSNTIDLVHVGLSSIIYVLGNHITMIDAVNNLDVGRILLPGNTTSKRIVFNSFNNYLYVLSNTKLFTIDPIVNVVISEISLGFVPNDIEINLSNGEIYITSDNGIHIYNPSSVLIKTILGKSSSLCYNYHDMDIYVNTDGGILRINGDTRIQYPLFVIDTLINSQVMFDPYSNRIYVFGTDRLYYIENNIIEQDSIYTLGSNYLLHNNLNGSIITNTDLYMESRGVSSFRETIDIGQIYLNQYDGNIYITTLNGTITIVNSTNGRTEEVYTLSNNANKLIFNPERNSMFGIQNVDNKVFEINTVINLEIVINEEVNNNLVDNQFGNLSQNYVTPIGLWLNVHDYIRKPRANYIGDVQKSYKWRWMDDTIPELFIYDLSGDQLAKSGDYKYTGEKPLSLITLSARPNKDINKCDKPEFQQTVFKEINIDLDYIDSETNLTFLPSPMELFIGYNDVNEGVTSNTLILSEVEKIDIDYTNDLFMSSELSISVMKGDIRGTYGIIKISDNSLRTFDALKVGQIISLKMFDDTNILDKYISNNNHYSYKITEIYTNTLLVSFENGIPVNESNTVVHNNKTIFLKTTLSVLPKDLATFVVTGQSEIEDIRYKIELDNVGQNISIDDTYIFSDYDINEQGIDWIYLNKKRKELLINRHDIYPYIGSYKAIINAINYFGYNDLELYEYYRNINIESTQYGSLYKVEIPDIFDNTISGWNESDYLKQTFPNSNYEDTNLFNLAYRITDREGNNVLSYSLREVLVKLQGLKYWLQDNVIPMTHRIMDITGRADFVNTMGISHKSYDIKATNIKESMTPIDLGVAEAYLMPINSGSTVYDVVIDFSSNGSNPPDYFTVDVTTFKTEKEWSPFKTYSKGDRISYYNFIYESVLPGKNRVRDPRRYSNSSNWSPYVNYKINDIIKYKSDYYQLINDIDILEDVIESPSVAISKWRCITEWKELDYEPVQIIKEFRTSMEQMHITLDSNLDPYVNIVVTSENGYGQIYKMIKNYEIRGTKDLVDYIMVDEVDPLPIRLVDPPALIPPTTTTTTTTTSTTTTTTTSTTTIPVDCSFSPSSSAIEVTTTTTMPPDCSFSPGGTAIEFTTTIPVGG